MQQDAKAIAAEAFRNVKRSTALPRPLQAITGSPQLQSLVMRRNEESGWAEP